MKILFCSCLFLLIFFPSPLTADDDDRSESKTVPLNRRLIILDKATQAASGLKTSVLKSASYRAESLSYGTAVSIEPLLAVQNQYLTALAQQHSAQAKLIFSQNNLQRLTYLHREQIISTRALQDQQTASQADKAVFDSSRYLTEQIINNARLTWGKTLIDWLIKSDATFSALMQQRTTLLKITFPTDSASTSVFKTIFIAANGQREQAIAAQLISAVPQTDIFSQSSQYFYQIPAKFIKAGMRINAWIPALQQAQIGVTIPESAVCWHLGQALVFVKLTEQQFASRALLAYTKIAGGYFVNTSLKPGEEIVTTGAQMLLSQEFKGQIPNEDD